MLDSVKNTSLDYCGMTLRTVDVTPEMATKWLEKLKNRTMRRRNFEAIGMDMLAGHYYPNPTVVICFDANGCVVNGQHTLKAIEQSGETHRLLVATNVPPKTVGIMDTGATRTFADAFAFLEEDSQPIASRGAAIVRALAGAHKISKKMTHAATADAYLKHQDAVDFVLRHFKQKKKQKAPATFLCVLARAWYQTGYRPRLFDFIEVIQSGIAKGAGDSAAIRLRDFMATNKSGGDAMRVEIERKTTNALWHFIHRKSISRLDGTDLNLFPLPGEESAE